MKINRVLTHDQGPDVVFQMACTKAFQERKCADAGALSWDVHITVDGDSAVVKTKRKLPTVGFPSMLRKIVPVGVTSTETITWQPAEADGSRDATLHVDFHGVPAKMAGTLRLEPHGDGARVRIDADFHSTVPVIGGKLDKLAAPIIIEIIDSEEKTGRAWAAESS